MMTLEETRQRILSLIATPLSLGAERLQDGARDYYRLAPAAIAEVRSLHLHRDDSSVRNQERRSALLRLVSLECAAGAPVDRCKAWFSCMSSLATWIPPGGADMISPSDAVVWCALSGQVQLSHLPETIPTQATPDRVVYRLFSGIKLKIESDSAMFDNAHWENLCKAIESRNSKAAAANFRAIADWWFQEYSDTDTEAYDPESFPSFEPVPNAALVIATLLYGLDIVVDSRNYENFYYVARMLLLR